MKTTPLTPLLVLVLFTGCAHFVTNQDQTDTVDSTGKVVGRETTTRVSATTFFDSKSALAQFRATQSDKTQSTSVGSLNQEASGSNAVALAEAVVNAAVTAAVKSVAPVPTPKTP